MKKKIILSFAIILTLCLITGCSKKSENNSKKNVSSDEEIIIKDEGFGTTKLSYSKDKDYKVSFDNTGKYTTVKVESEKENFVLEMYHFDSVVVSYEEGKENRKNSNEFKEYKWNGYEGYSYNGDKYSIDFNVLLKTNDNKVKALFGTVSYSDSNTANVSEVFKSSEFQKLLKSISFEE